MKKITEHALLFRVNQLNEKLAMHEATQQPTQQQPQQGGVMQSIGNALGTAAGYATAGPRAVVDAGQYAYNHAGGAVDAVKNAASGAVNAVSQGVQNLGQGIKQGWNNTDPAKMAGINVDAQPQQPQPQPKQPTQQKQPAQPKQPTQQKQPAQQQQAKFDPAVQKIQQDLIAKGYPLKADGIMGPKTQAAMDWQAQSDSRDAKIQGYDTAKKNMDPNQSAAQQPAPAGAAAITPAFQSQAGQQAAQQPAAQQPAAQQPAAQQPAAQQPAAPAPTAQQSAYNSSALGQMQRALQQQEAGQSIQTAPPQKPEGVTVYKESVELDRILQLSKW